MKQSDQGFTVRCVTVNEADDTYIMSPRGEARLVTFNGGGYTALAWCQSSRDWSKAIPGGDHFDTSDEAIMFAKRDLASARERHAKR